MKKGNSWLNKIAGVLLAGSAMLTGAAPPPAVNTAPGSNEIQTKSKETPAPVQQTEGQQQIARPIVGGMEIAGTWDGGIPPHIYGIHYVKKGTHKRTNKKR